jgi:hypothetical protein
MIFRAGSFAAAVRFVFDLPRTLLAPLCRPVLGCTTIVAVMSSPLDRIRLARLEFECLQLFCRKDFHTEKSFVLA